MSDFRRFVTLGSENTVTVNVGSIMSVRQRWFGDDDAPPLATLQMIGGQEINLGDYFDVVEARIRYGDDSPEAEAAEARFRNVVTMRGGAIGTVRGFSVSGTANGNRPGTGSGTAPGTAGNPRLEPVGNRAEPPTPASGNSGG